MKRMILAALVLTVVCACALSTPYPDRPQTARGDAAMQLTLSGRQQLDAGRPDNALRLFEQAIGLDPDNGPCYYYIAQAWLDKGEPAKARQFNQLAREYIRDDAPWLDRLDRQSMWIERMAEDAMD